MTYKRKGHRRLEGSHRRLLDGTETVLQLGLILDSSATDDDDNDEKHFRMDRDLNLGSLTYSECVLFDLHDCTKSNFLPKSGDKRNYMTC